MKRMLALLLVLVLGLALVGCQADPSILNLLKPGSSSSESTEASEDTSVAGDPEPENSDTPTEATSAPEPTAETIADARLRTVEEAKGILTERVSTGGDYTVSFDDGYSQTYSYNYHVPNLTPDTAGAKSINDKIETRFVKEAYAEETNIERNIGSSVVEINWQVEIWEGVISLLVFDRYDWEQTEYEVYYYDTADGSELSASQVLSRYGLSEEAYLAGVYSAIEAKYEDNWKDLTEDQKVDLGYYTLFSVVDEMMDLEHLPFFLCSDGTLGVAAPVPSIAGAAYYYMILYPSF